MEHIDQEIDNKNLLNDKQPIATPLLCAPSIEYNNVSLAPESGIGNPPEEPNLPSPSHEPSTSIIKPSIN